MQQRIRGSKRFQGHVETSGGDGANSKPGLSAAVWKRGEEGRRGRDDGAERREEGGWADLIEAARGRDTGLRQRSSTLNRKPQMATLSPLVRL